MKDRNSTALQIMVLAAGLSAGASTALLPILPVRRSRAPIPPPPRGIGEWMTRNNRRVERTHGRRSNDPIPKLTAKERMRKAEKARRAMRAANRRREW